MTSQARRDRGADLTEQTPPHPPIRLVALDLDDTLLLPDKTLSERTKRTVQEVQRLGVHVVPASARPLQSVLDYGTQLGVKGYCIALNGAVTATAPGGEVLRVEALPDPVLRSALHIARALKPNNVYVELADGFAVERVDDDVGGYSAITGRVPYRVGNLHELAPGPHCKVAVHIQGATADAAKQIEKALGDRVHLVVWEGQWSWIEILSAGTSKAAALSWLAQRLGVEREAVMAVGDQRNDIEMLEWAGVGVAMGHGHPDAIAAADYVTDSNAEDGCAKALERFVLGQA